MILLTLKPFDKRQPPGQRAIGSYPDGAAVEKAIREECEKLKRENTGEHFGENGERISYTSPSCFRIYGTRGEGIDFVGNDIDCLCRNFNYPLTETITRARCFKRFDFVIKTMQ